MHHREWKATTNTSRLLSLLSEKCTIHLRGKPNESLQMAPLLETQDRNILFLYPHPDSLVLNAENLEKTFKNIQAFTLFVPDGTWRQAQKVYKREILFENIPKFKLASDVPETQYFLRREPRADGMATFEAIAHALGVLESQNTKQILLDFFKIFVKRTLDSRQGIFSPLSEI